MRLWLESGKMAGACASSSQGVASDKSRQAGQRGFAAEGSVLQAHALCGESQTLASSPSS